MLFVDHNGNTQDTNNIPSGFTIEDVKRNMSLNRISCLAPPPRPTVRGNNWPSAPEIKGDKKPMLKFKGTAYEVYYEWVCENCDAVNKRKIHKNSIKTGGFTHKECPCCGIGNTIKFDDVIKEEVEEVNLTADGCKITATITGTVEEEEKIKDPLYEKPILGGESAST